MDSLERIEQKLDAIMWEVRWGSLYSPSGKYITLDPITHTPISGVLNVPPKPQWPPDSKGNTR